MMPPPGNAGYGLVMALKPKVQAGRAIWGVTTAHFNVDLVAGPNPRRCDGSHNPGIDIGASSPVPEWLVRGKKPSDAADRGS